MVGAPIRGVPVEVAVQSPAVLPLTARIWMSCSIPPSRPVSVYSRSPDVQTEVSVQLASIVSSSLVSM